MELILNLNQLNYKDFLNSKVDSITLGLENFCSGYLTTYKLSELPKIVEEIHSFNKKINLAINIIANQQNINELISVINEIKSLNVDGFVISDYGVLQIFIENNLSNKVTFNPVTNITNKYCAKSINSLNINHICVANELNLNDILEVSKFNKGNIEILAQGYYQICNSKRHLLSNFFKNFKIDNTSKYYYIKEESRDYAYPIIEVNNEILIYIDKQRCILPYLKQILDTKVKYLRIDTMFLDQEETKMQIQAYNNAINDLSNIDEILNDLKNKSNSNFKCLDNISILKKEKKND